MLKMSWMKQQVVEKSEFPNFYKTNQSLKFGEDVIFSVGSRVKYEQGAQFRISLNFQSK